MGPRDSVGLQVGVAIAAPTKNPSNLPFGQQQSRGPNKSSEIIDGQESNSASSESERVFQSHVRGSQGKGLMASGDQSKISEYLPRPSPFQDGRDQCSKEPDPEG